MNIRKVKSSNGVITIRAEEQCGEEDVRRIELESRAEPRPEFHQAMGGLIGPALRMIQAPEAWSAVATISGVSITHEEERGMGGVVTLLVPLECAPSPLVINTPYLISYLTGDGVGAPVLPDDLRQAIVRVMAEALRYMAGERAQSDLFAEHAVHDADGVVEELEQPSVYSLINDGSLSGSLEQQPAAQPKPPADGPILDRPPSYVGAEFDRLRAEAIRNHPGRKQARGRRAAKDLL